jgi:hypothetical protein
VVERDEAPIRLFVAHEQLAEAVELDYFAVKKIVTSAPRKPETITPVEVDDRINDGRHCEPASPVIATAEMVLTPGIARHAPAERRADGNDSRLDGAGSASWSSMKWP